MTMWRLFEKDTETTESCFEVHRRIVVFHLGLGDDADEVCVRGVWQGSGEMWDLIRPGISNNTAVFSESEISGLRLGFQISGGP